MNLLRAFLGLLAVDLILEWSGFAPGLALILTVTLVGLGVILAVRYARWTIRKTIWRLRNRLMVAYAFIAVVPILLILALQGVGAWIVTGQIAVYLVSSELERRAALLENPARFLSRARPAERTPMIQQLGPLISESLPGFEVLVTGDQPLRYPEESRIAAPPDGWKDSTGFVVRDGRYYCISVAHEGKTQATVMAEITPHLLGRLVPGIGLLDLTQVTRNLNPGGELPRRNNWVDFETWWVGGLSFQRWDQPGRNTIAQLYVQTRPSAVLGALFRNRFEDAQVVLVGFFVIATLLLIVVVLALVIGFSLSKTITGAVHGLYEGTLRIAQGDFGHRIPVTGTDQLADLGHSFNNMTMQLESLVKVAKEKERLQSELEIASEVQNQLFPRSAPSMRTIELIGVCEPASMVSGDYFDYLCLPNGHLALALGDVAGKGISAALLMASIQSIVRTQLASAVNCSTSAVVAQLNRQLYANTAPEKYATFFFGVYDDESRTLTYTNAGHLPPMLVRGEEVIPLEVTGTVVGAFPVANYEEQIIRIERGDLLIAYTDGITEPENAYGEEFGAERLAEVAMRHQASAPREIVAKIMEAVGLWSAAAELPDDMTVLIARGLN